MGRPPKLQRVDYFPHMCIHKKTMFIIEQKYGNDGYAFWFKLLEQLGVENGHFLDMKIPHVWEFMQARAQLDVVRCREILDHLARLDAIDRELWEENLVIWSQNFVDNLAEIYRKRNTPLPHRPVVSAPETRQTGSFRAGNSAIREFPRRKLGNQGVSGAESAARIGQDRIGQEREDARACFFENQETDLPPPDPPVVGIDEPEEPSPQSHEGQPPGGAASLAALDDHSFQEFRRLMPLPHEEQLHVGSASLSVLSDHSFQAFKRLMPLRNGKFLEEDDCRQYWDHHRALWSTWIRNVKPYRESKEVRDGVVCKPMTFLVKKYRDWNVSEEPLGESTSAGPDVAWVEQRKQWDQEAAEYARKVSAGEVAEAPRPVPAWRQSAVAEDVEKPDAGMG